MKKLLKSLIFGTLSVAVALSMTACGGEPDDKSNKAKEQVEAAESTYNSFYNKNGFFTSQTATASVTALADEGEATGFAAVREALSKYNFAANGSMKLDLPSYVADIFAYSQVQSSILEQYGEQSLTDVYTLSYETVDWSSDTTGFAEWIKSTKLLSAAFAGADLETGYIYCTQSHVSRNVLVLADMEYYYNSDGDMGVTTINYRGDGRFEYHYCSAGTYEVLQANGTYGENGEIALTQFNYLSQAGQLISFSVEVADEELVFNFVKDEAQRIGGKIDELQEQNGRERELDGNEEEAEEHVKSCSVNLDFAILKKMLDY